ncbi:hypothetical protein [Helicobacter pylori]|uniref:hypothetical protein n=1 Tax=Helicobacter pylori TaxID=210 RepID=UPI000AE5C708|nr:hypothetical protein [Helicobacter pylori]
MALNIQAFKRSSVQAFKRSSVQAFKQHYHSFYKNLLKNPLLFIIHPFFNQHDLFRKFNSISPIFISGAYRVKFKGEKRWLS